MSSQLERLTKLAGFDPAKRPKVTDEILKEVMGEIQEKREELARKRARDLMEQALKLHEEMEKEEKEFIRQKAKFNKELGKILNQLEGDLRQAGVAQENQPEEVVQETE
jgi:hypothetical protein